MSKYKTNIKNKTISCLNSYFPYGLSLGDFSSYLEIEDLQNESNDIPTIWVHDHDVASETDKSQQLFNRITNQLYNQRRNNLASHTIADYENISDFENPSESNATIQFTIPINYSTDNLNLNDIVNFDKFYSGLSLLNMSINSEILINSPQNIRKFTGESIAQLINSIKDDQVLENIFNNIENKKKFHVLKSYLSNDEIISEFKHNQSQLPKKSKFSNFFNVANNDNYHYNNGTNLETMLVSLVQAVYAFSVLLYTTFGIPILNQLYIQLQELNSRYNVLDTLLTLFVKALTAAIAVSLRVVLVCTTILQNNRNNNNNNATNTR